MGVVEEDGEVLRVVLLVVQEVCQESGVGWAVNHPRGLRTGNSLSWRRPVDFLGWRFGMEAGACEGLLHLPCACSFVGGLFLLSDFRCPRRPK